MSLIACFQSAVDCLSYPMTSAQSGVPTGRREGGKTRPSPYYAGLTIIFLNSEKITECGIIVVVIINIILIIIIIN